MNARNYTSTFIYIAIWPLPMHILMPEASNVYSRSGKHHDMTPEARTYRRIR